MDREDLLELGTLVLDEWKVEEGFKSQILEACVDIHLAMRFV